MKLRKIEKRPLAEGKRQPGTMMKGLPLIFALLVFLGIGCAHEPVGELFAENDVFQDIPLTPFKGGIEPSRAEIPFKGGLEPSRAEIPFKGGAEPSRAEKNPPSRRARGGVSDNPLTTAQASEDELGENDLDLWDKPEKGDSEGEDDLDLWDEEETEVEAPLSVADPLEPWNRIMFHFNDKLYYWVLKPVATGYKAVTPAPVRMGVKNFFRNLTTPIRMANCVLQGKLHSAETEFARFLINSTVGVLGFVDVAGNNPHFAKPPEEDLGQTLAVYGLGNGFYFVWPILGPSTLRDSAGTLGDRFLSPITWTDIPSEAAVGITVFETVNETSFRLGDYESIKDAAIEPYEAFRDAYLQYRKKKAENTDDGKDDRRYDILIKEWIK